MNVGHMHLCTALWRRRRRWGLADGAERRQAQRVAARTRRFQGFQRDRRGFERWKCPHLSVTVTGDGNRQKIATKTRLKKTETQLPRKTAGRHINAAIAARFAGFQPNFVHPSVAHWCKDSIKLIKTRMYAPKSAENDGKHAPGPRRGVLSKKYLTTNTHFNLSIKTSQTSHARGRCQVAAMATDSAATSKSECRHCVTVCFCRRCVEFQRLRRRSSSAKAPAAFCVFSDVRWCRFLRFWKSRTRFCRRFADVCVI